MTKKINTYDVKNESAIALKHTHFTLLV